MKSLARSCALLSVLALGVTLSAQVAEDTPVTPTFDSATFMANALKLRGEVATAMASGQENPEAILRRLRANFAPAGLEIDADGDFAFAAIDVGRRLIATHKPAEAELFFLAAGKSLDLVIRRTTDSSAKDKVQYLSQRAFLRAIHLNTLTEARTDLDLALKLTPDNKQLQQTNRQLAVDPATAIQNHKELPSRG